MTNEDLSTLLLCSVRYALGRRSYIVGDVCRIVRETLKEIDSRDAGVGDNTRGLIIRDIGEELARGHAGGACDVAEWRKLLGHLGVTS